MNIIGSFHGVLRYRSLITALAEKDIKIRYKSAALGWLWSVLHPILLMAIFALLFSYFFRIEIQYPPLYLLAGLLPWFFFSSSVGGATTSIVENSSLIKTVQFPREIIPWAVLTANFFNFIISFVLLILSCLIFIGYSPALFFLPVVILEQIILTAALCLLVSSCHTIYRDIKYIVELLMLIWLYATPVFYPLSIVPESARFYYRFNPLAVFVHQYRNILIDRHPPDYSALAGWALASILLYWLGTIVFHRLEPVFADVT